MVTFTNYIIHSKLELFIEFSTEILKSLEIEKLTYSAPGGDGHIPQLILPVVSEAWGFNSDHLKPNLEPENLFF